MCIRDRSRIEQHIDEPMEDEEKEEFVELMTRGQFVQMCIRDRSMPVTFVRSPR